MTDPTPGCPNACVNGLVSCSDEECEFIMDKVGPVKECSHCAGAGTEPSRQERFHADV